MQNNIITLFIDLICIMSQPPVGNVRHQQHQQHQQQYSTPVDIKAVPGLRVCTNFFTHRIENTLYHDSHFFPHSERRVEQIAATQRRKEKKGSTITKCVPGKTSGGIGHFGDDNDPIDEDEDDSDIAENDSQKPNNHNKNTNDKQGCPDVLLKLCNGVIESGLEPELFFAPNNCTLLFLWIGFVLFCLSSSLFFTNLCSMFVVVSPLNIYFVFVRK